MRPEVILAFDTSAAHCAAALLLPDGRCLNRVERMDKGQADRLIPLLDDLLRDAGLGWPDVSRLAVGTGPGNFTGVRLAVSAARGVALARRIPATGVTTLQALAFGQAGPVLVAMDARRDQAYVQGFSGPGVAGAAAMVPAGDLPADLPFDLAGAACIGDLAADYAARHGLRALPPALPLAEAMARHALGHPAPPGTRPAPFYLRGADAAPPADPPPRILP